MLCLSMACGCLVSRNRQLFSHKAVRSTRGASLRATGICCHWRRQKSHQKSNSNPWNVTSVLNENNHFESDILPSLSQQLSYVEQSYIHFHSTPSYNEFLIDTMAHADASAQNSLILPNVNKVGVSCSSSGAPDTAAEYTFQRIQPSELQRTYDNSVESWNSRYQRAVKLDAKAHKEVTTARRHKPEFYRGASKVSEAPSKLTILPPISSIGQDSRLLQGREEGGVKFGAGNSSPEGMHTFLNKCAVEASSDNMQLELASRGDDELRGPTRQRSLTAVALGREADILYSNDEMPQSRTSNVTSGQSPHSPLYQETTSHRKNTISIPSARTDVPSTTVLPRRAGPNNSDLYCRVRNVYVLPDFSYCLSAPGERLE
ncbi:unnamed protein product [Schistocephalus solidus]|uniref:Uncharacterized protein n=1 Tax=Schistocephalus solidus TaxID=70667 RepID=A0A183SQ85_SCHSO|nr:unnamed protein product [Schistocephalus solidus]